MKKLKRGGGGQKHFRCGIQGRHFQRSRTYASLKDGKSQTYRKGGKSVSGREKSCAKVQMQEGVRASDGKREGRDEIVQNTADLVAS